MLTTMTTMTTITTSTAPTQIVFLGLLSVILLIMLLIAKELLTSLQHEKSRTLGAKISIAVNPLLFTFTCIVIVKIIEVLS